GGRAGSLDNAASAAADAGYSGCANTALSVAAVRWRRELPAAPGGGFLRPLPDDLRSDCQRYEAGHAGFGAADDRICPLSTLRGDCHHDAEAARGEHGAADGSRLSDSAQSLQDHPGAPVGQQSQRGDAVSAAENLVSNLKGQHHRRANGDAAWIQRRIRNGFVKLNKLNFPRNITLSAPCKITLS